MRVLDDNCVPFTETFAYDAAGRMVKEGEKTYKYGYLDKVLSVTEGSDKYTYDYHVDGQLATATYGGTTEDFLWDGLALVKRGKRGFVNEPHVGGGNPVMSSDGTTYFNDMLGTTLSATRNGETAASSLSAFGDTSTQNSQLTTPSSDTFFTGKPFVPGLGHAFLMRNYRSDLGKWQTADPLGYPDGWNQLAYCNNGVMDAVDLWGGYCEGGCGHLWHEFLDPAFYTKPYSDEIIKDFPTKEELEKRLERLEAEKTETRYSDRWRDNFWHRKIRIEE